jgi:hypothetical protein
VQLPPEYVHGKPPGVNDGMLLSAVKPSAVLSNSGGLPAGNGGSIFVSGVPN